MGILSLPFLIIHHIVTYLYPLYASYKAIVAVQEGRPGFVKTVNGEEKTELAALEGWLMYWCVVGTMNIVEGWGEWAWSWLPFYDVGKLVFTLWLVLPQTKGSTHLYVNYLAPFLQSHEDDIDVAIESARSKASKAAGQWLANIWEQVRSAVLGAAVGESSNTSQGQAELPGETAGPTHPPATMHDPMAGSASQLFGLVKRFGPMAAAGVVSAMDRAANAARSETVNEATATSTATAVGGSSGSSAAAARRRALEQELGAGSQMPPTAAAAPDRDPWSSSSASASASNSDNEASPAVGTTRYTKQGSGRSAADLSGSYQLVDDDENDDGVHDSRVQTPATPRRGGGWTGWLRSGGGAGDAAAPSTSPS